MIRKIAAILLSIAAASGVAHAQPDGAALYQRCAACHLATGAGVPGVFPPLDTHVGQIAARPAGRAYLVMILAKGNRGRISVGGRSYNGIMPIQALGDAEAAALLNFVLTTKARAGLPSRWIPFTEAEVRTTRARYASITPDALLALREAALR